MSELSWTMLLLHGLGCLGFVLVVSLGKIAARIRKAWPAMLSCPQCFGVWAAAPWAVLLATRALLPAWTATVHDVIAFTFAVSALGYLAGAIDTAAGAAKAYKLSSLMRWGE